MTTARDTWLAEEELTQLIIGSLFRDYNKLGFGFLEHVYAAAIEAVGGPEGRPYRLDAAHLI